MSDERSLYQKVILDHNKQPRNFCKLDNPTCQAEGRNPLCGDQFTIYLRVVDDAIEKVNFEGCGCAISKASASLMTSMLEGKSIQEAQELFSKFHDMITSEPDTPVDKNDVGKLIVFSGVREYPVRVKCATLAWHAMMAALNNEQEAVSTE